MTLDLLLGRTSTLTIRRLGSLHATLATDRGEAVALPGRELPPGAAVGDRLRVFVHHGSGGQPVATTATPRVERDEVAFLTATALSSFGAFFDWGLGKELLVPFAEQTVEVGIGARHPIGVLLDRSGRLSGTMRVSELLREPSGEFALDQWVEGEAWRNDPDIGLFAILERRFVGLVPATEPHPLSRGEAARFRISRILPDGRVDLTLRGPAHEESARDAERILEVLSRPGAPSVNDRSSPEEIRELFGLAKKSFKRAAGRLLKEQLLAIDRAGFYRKVHGGPLDGRGGL